MFLYCTADQIGCESGGGLVTYHERNALRKFAELKRGYVQDISREEMLPFKHYDYLGDPWKWDTIAQYPLAENHSYDLAHFYAGTFTETVKVLVSNGVKVSYTAAAHSIEKSKQEHEKLGIPFEYPHLIQPELWAKYVEGYLKADVVICPSTISKKTMEEFGAKNVKVIPHGVDIPKKPVPIPNSFTVGYLGAISPDKGIIYLLQAWKKLNVQNGLLIIGGSASRGDLMQHWINQYGGGNIFLAGWVNDVSSFYNAISLYVQPSVTEGFGIEVLESLAHGRPTLVSDGAGAVDVIPNEWKFKAGDVDSLCEAITKMKESKEDKSYVMNKCRGIASKYTWDRVENQYIELWKEMLC